VGLDAAGGGRVRLRLLSYATVGEAWVAASEAAPLRHATHPVGAALRVDWGGKAWEARVTAVEGEFMRITYPGWPEVWDEWILAPRVLGEAGTGASFAPGAAVDVEWKSRWWPARVTQAGKARWLVRYDGYGPEDDEWVGPERIRARGPEVR
jgi:hypothetical protein